MPIVEGVVLSGGGDLVASGTAVVGLIEGVVIHGGGEIVVTGQASGGGVESGTASISGGGSPSATGEKGTSVSSGDGRAAGGFVLLFGDVAPTASVHGGGSIIATGTADSEEPPSEVSGTATISGGGGFLVIGDVPNVARISGGGRLRVRGVTDFVSLGPGLPSIRVELALEGAADTPVWQKITTYVRDYELTKGRQDVLDRIETAQGVLVLSNRDRTFDPSYSGGPYYGSLRPLRRVRVTMRLPSGDYPRCVMYTRGWPQAYAHSGKDATVALRLHDGFGVANIAKFPVGWTAPLERTDERINGVLDLLGVPVSERSIQQGFAEISAVTLDENGAGRLDGTPLLAHLLDVADAEGGQLFISKTGTWIFQNRHHRNVTEVDTIAATFGDNPSGPELPYKDIVIEDDDAELWNEAQVTPASGLVQEHTDAASVEEFYPRTWTKSLPMSSDPDALARAQHVVLTHREPHLRCPQLDLKPHDRDVVWPAVLSLEISNRVDVSRFTSTTDEIAFAQNVEGYHEKAAPGMYELTYWMSAADTQEYWELGISELGFGTVLGY